MNYATFSPPYCNRSRAPTAGAVLKVGRNIASSGRGRGRSAGDSSMAHLRGLQENSSSLHVQQSQGFLRREAAGSLGVSEGQVSL